MADSTSIPKWKSVNPNRKDPVETERSIRVLDRQSQVENTNTISVLQTIETNITNITNGTTTVSAKWVAYTGPVLLWWFVWPTCM